MGKITRSVICILALASLFLSCASASSNNTSNTTISPSSVAEGDWEVYTPGVRIAVVPMEALTTSNAAWLQLLTDGVTLSGPSEICHPFRGGQFGWAGIIYQLDGYEWKKLETTAKWYPDTSGEFIACAYAPAAGTYTLFGYYTAADTKACNKYSISSLDAVMVGDNGFIYFGTISPAVANIEVTYKISQITPAGAITGALTASAYTDEGGNFQFSEPFFIDFEVVTGFHQKFYIDGCELSLGTS
jgi:hypothetical protein